MGRPRKFTEEAALSEILTVFQAKGYEAASIDDITKASGLSRASLYGVFGSKEQVFRETLKVYMAGVFAGLQLRIASESEPLVGLRAWFNVLPERCGKQGCLLAVALTERPNLSKEVGEDIDVYLSELSKTILDALEKAQSRGKLSRFIGSELDKEGAKLVGLYFAVANLVRGNHASLCKDIIESTLRTVD